jgi:SH3 domain
MRPRASPSPETEIAAFKRVTWEESKLQLPDVPLTSSIQNGKKEEEHVNIYTKAMEIYSCVLTKGTLGNAPQPLMYAQALYDYEADDRTSLSFYEGDVIQVITQLESGWWDGVINGVRGWFPSNYYQVITNLEQVLEDPSNRSDIQPRLPCSWYSCIREARKDARFCTARISPLTR